MNISNSIDIQETVQNVNFVAFACQKYIHSSVLAMFLWPKEEKFRKSAILIWLAVSVASISYSVREQKEDFVTSSLSISTLNRYFHSTMNSEEESGNGIFVSIFTVYYLLHWIDSRKTTSTDGLTLANAIILNRVVYAPILKILLIVYNM
uniref:Uncharacterized protein n=1 Tax=Glossina palpalis gambiensis TaxID=67801 RepID=A0A1B0B1C6_9MUSC